MTTTSLIFTDNSSIISHSRPFLDESKKRFDDLVITIFKKIVADNYDAVTNCSKSSVKTKLGKGCFYPKEYYDTLTKMEQVTRLEWFKKNGSFYHGYASPKHFTHRENERMPLGKDFCAFDLKAGVNPSDALNAFVEELSLVDCACAYQISHYMAIQKELGKDKFDALFASDSKTPLSINTDDEPLYLIFHRGMRLPSLSRVQKGQVINIAGPKNYMAKHLVGEDQAINVMCIDDTCDNKKFIGLGTPSEGLSFDQVCDVLFVSYNKKPLTATEILTSDLAQKVVRFLPKNSCKDQLTKEEFFKEGGGQIQGCVGLDYERIDLLKSLSIPEGQVFMEFWKKQGLASSNKI